MRMLPDTLAQFSAGKNATRLAHEHLQQHKFTRGQLDSLCATMDHVIHQIEREIVNSQVQRGLFRVTPSQCAYPR